MLGQVIGTVGPKNVYNIKNNPYKDENGNPTNGATTGCHLHLTIKENKIAVDPLNYFNYMYYVDYRFQAKPVIWNIRRRYDAYMIMQLERGAIMERYIDNEFKKYGIDPI